MRKSVFNDFFYGRNIHQAEQKLSKVIGSKCIYVAITYQPKIIELY